MSLSSILYSSPGMFVIQSVFHAMIAVIVVESAITVWQIHSPAVRQRFRAVVILAPALSYPVYQMIDPDRGSFFFRAKALLDSGRWLSLELWGLISLGLAVLLVLCASSLVFLFQEMIPIVRHLLGSREKSVCEPGNAGGDALRRALENLPGDKPALRMVDAAEPVIFSTTGNKACIYVSTGLAHLLNQEELQAAIAHEVAHIRRSRLPSLIVLFLFRVLLFFNPIVLIEFRRTVQEEEKICDDLSAGMTGNPRALAGALRKLYYRDGSSRPFSVRKVSEIRKALEKYSHDMLIAGRIKRLEESPSPQGNGAWGPFMLTLFVILLINYYMV